MSKLRLERLSAGSYRWNHYAVFSVVIGSRKEWRVTWKGMLVSQKGSLALAKESILIHSEKIRNQTGI